MARVKPKRHGVVTDMTAMTDVAFLLLTFFILTAQFKKPDAEAITTPSSISTTTLDDTNLMTISITPDGRYFFTPIDNNSEKSQVLDKMAGQYRVGFSAAEKNTFLKLPMVGASMAQMKSYLNLPEDQRANVKGATIPMDSVNKELVDWVKYSLEVNPDARLAIKGDANAQYPKFKALFEGLKDIKFYKFVLITSSENQ
ncbi:biopolymer transporter ExbD [Elizabethkingia anophelis]|uniref:ExbD/TolR family protein n=1 Tax=Elizabethkingia anophelis TaxID=1117645 RepID=UPI00077EA44B|nr:biopolymer transporter ExbD [Elizabethkingia anophelis]AMR42547.1 biopolymer transporter ExbD [Elizabethkingia anophelis]AMX49187.1 biopolymer transporter ExbD [Elizabethkingia anophelis]AMX52645.1 biopolymer transporter ExbD [Elizabethkingia anophelis]AMX56036.1 biopolymer transporter ExbD [Elizabethkingia anophelis]EGT4346829.1 biopolymer transporter ExbD [Elizabethkingia anophelis]